MGCSQQVYIYKDDLMNEQLCVAMAESASGNFDQ